MTRNKLSTKFKANLNKKEWIDLCPPGEYRVFSIDDVECLGIVPDKMQNVNSVIIGTSGSDSGTIMFFADYCRIDPPFIDQEPYIELYENGSTACSLHGILHHADFRERSVILSQDIIDRISASGSNIDIQFTSKPTKKQGKLSDLRDEGKITGFNYAWNEVKKHIDKDVENT